MSDLSATPQPDNVRRGAHQSSPQSQPILPLGLAVRRQIVFGIDGLQRIEWKREHIVLRDPYAVLRTLIRIVNQKFESGSRI